MYANSSEISPKLKWRKSWSSARFYAKYDVIFGYCAEQKALELLFKRNIPLHNRNEELQDVPY